MPSEASRPAVEWAIRDALKELLEAGGQKRYVHCRFGYKVVSRLRLAGLATMDTGLTNDAYVRLTDEGQAALDRAEE